MSQHDGHVVPSVVGQRRVDQCLAGLLIRLAKEMYEHGLRALLETEHRDEFVAIEPISKPDYLGKPLRETAKLARRACPGRLT